MLLGSEILIKKYLGIPYNRYYLYQNLLDRYPPVSMDRKNIHKKVYSKITTEIRQLIASKQWKEIEFINKF